MPAKDRQHLYETAIRRMVTESLRQKEKAFAEDHANDTDEELLNYLRGYASLLGHSPHPKEVEGWIYLMERFGAWPEVLYAAGLPKPSVPDKPMSFRRIKDEIELQKIIYRSRKTAKKEKAAQRLAEQTRRKRTSLKNGGNRKDKIA